jgi:hypothetical protein
MSWLISVICSVIIGAQTLQVPAASKHHRTPKHCGFEFDYPSGWVIHAEDNTCRVQLRPRDFSNRMKKRDVDLYTVEVNLLGGDFLAAAAAEHFDFVRGKWVVLGRQGAATDAEVVLSERWHGLRGLAATGCHYESGGYAGLCEQSVVLLRDDKDNMWSMTGGPQSTDAFEAILATLRFVEQ